MVGPLPARHAGQRRTWLDAAINKRAPYQCHLIWTAAQYGPAGNKSSGRCHQLAPVLALYLSLPALVSTSANYFSTANLYATQSNWSAR